MALAALLCGLLVVVGCTSLPPRTTEADAVPMSAADPAGTRLARSLDARLAAHPGRSGIWPLADPHDAFATRVLLARAADRTLDVQYYIWHGDLTGTLLLHELLVAADRGVQVRLLLDDNGDAVLDGVLAALDGHPRIAVRLFNPFTVRSAKWLGYVGDFGRANRRMHNKSFSADAQATIVGGRNVGDEYFGATEGILFADLDVLAVGPAAKDVSADFERYWTSASAHPAADVLPAVDAAQRDALRAQADATLHDPKALAYVEALRASQSIRALLAGQLGFEWATTRLVSDDPAKGLARGRESDLLFHQLAEVLGDPVSQVDLVSPYFVPTEAGVAMFAGLAQRGVRVRVLTNSLAATDVAAVHAGYAKRRHALLAAGVQLYEMRPTAADAQKRKKAGPFGSSGSSLHAKTFAVDRARVFVGSFNFDPRSARLNTELGLVIDSPALAAKLGPVFDDPVAAMAYEVRLDPNGRLYWLAQVDGRTVRHETEPETGPLQRLGVGVLSLLSIEWLL